MRRSTIVTVGIACISALAPFLEAEPEREPYTVCAAAREMRISTILNAARHLVLTGQVEAARETIGGAENALEPLEPSLAKAQMLVHGSWTWERILASTNAPPHHWRSNAAKWLINGCSTAQEIGDQRTLAMIFRMLGNLYWLEGRSSEGIECSRRAAFHAQEIGADDILFEAEWQSARIQQAMGDLANAFMAYRRAIRAFQNAPTRSGSDVFAEFADLLLEKSGACIDPATGGALLIEARDAIEMLRAAELQDYFRDECADWWRTRARPVDRMPDRAAVVHLVLLRDRVELMVGIRGMLRRFAVAVGERELMGAAFELRKLLEKRSTYQFLPEAQVLFEWLVRPTIGLLDAAGIDTIVWVPDGPLRIVPAAALHDGDRFLVERFAVAVVPGLTLLDPKPLRAGPVTPLLAGFSEGTGDLKPLRFVQDELRRIQSVFGGGKILLDRQFDAAAFHRELVNGNYSIVHVASHALFESDSEQSSIVAHDGKFGLDLLEQMIRPSRFRGQPIELLTLSACDTAAGSERAGMGLAGVAMKSGARSVLATLWHVNDEASAIIMGNFYRLLTANGGNTKAEALRAAQLEMLRDLRYSHPCYWSPYLIIGNWL